MPPRTGNERFVFIDAMRGIACVGVLLHHLLHNTVMEITLRKILPSPIQMICGYGARGVQIFFVISGFVVAYSLRDFVPSPRYVGNFIVRRQVRLDPTYWATIIFVIAMAAVERSLPGLARAPSPSILQIAANMFYLQNILRVPQVVGVAWTLCIEVQFYLALICLLWIAYAFAKEIALTVVAPILLVGLAMLSGWISIRTPQSPYFTSYWFYFAAGVLCSWSLRDSINNWVCVAFLTIFGIFAAYLRDSAIWFGFVAALAIYAVGRSNRLTIWSGGRALQYLGRISYSLYLVHLTVLSIVLRGAYKLTHENRWAALCWFILAAFICIGVAHLWNFFIETPTMRSASRLKKFATKQTTVAAAPTSESLAESPTLAGASLI